MKAIYQAPIGGDRVVSLTSVRCSRVRFPGGAVLNCWDGGAAETASMVDCSRLTKVNHFCNGM